MLFRGKLSANAEQASVRKYIPYCREDLQQNIDSLSGDSAADVQEIDLILNSWTYHLHCFRISHRTWLRRAQWMHAVGNYYYTLCRHQIVSQQLSARGRAIASHERCAAKSA